MNNPLHSTRKLLLIILHTVPAFLVSAQQAKGYSSSYRVDSQLIDEAHKATDWTPGKVLRIDPPYLVFYAGSETLEFGETLTLTRFGGVVASLSVVDTQGKVGIAQVSSMAPGQYPVPTDLVKLKADERGRTSFSFFSGPSFTRKTSNYGGLHYTLGLNFLYRIVNDWELTLHLQADGLGKDISKVEKRVSSYMFGGAYRTGPLHWAAALGSQDLMSIREGFHVLHDSEMAYMLGVQSDFTITPITRNRICGFGMGHWSSFTTTFKRRDLNPLWSLGINFKLNCDIM